MENETDKLEPDMEDVIKKLFAELLLGKVEDLIDREMLALYGADNEGEYESLEDILSRAPEFGNDQIGDIDGNE